MDVRGAHVLHERFLPCAVALGREHQSGPTGSPHGTKPSGAFCLLRGTWAPSPLDRSPLEHRTSVPRLVACPPPLPLAGSIEHAVPLVMPLRPRWGVVTSGGTLRCCSSCALGRCRRRAARGRLCHKEAGVPPCNLSGPFGFGATSTVLLHHHRHRHRQRLRQRTAPIQTLAASRGQLQNLPPLLRGVGAGARRLVF